MCGSRKIAYAGWNARSRAVVRGSLLPSAPPAVPTLTRALVTAHLGGREEEAADRIHAVLRSLRDLEDSGDRGAPPGLDPIDPAIGRWAVVVRREDRVQAEEALRELIELRQKQDVAFDGGPGGTGVPGLVEMLAPQTSNPDVWLESLSDATGGEPPHYLLLVGGPTRFPFELEARLSAIHAVGRLDCGATVEDPGADSLSWAACKAYAAKVARFERGDMPVARRALLYSFATDDATSRAHEEMMQRIDKHLRAPKTLTALRVPPGPPLPDLMFDDAATTRALREKLRSERPAVVVTATHGLEFPENHGLWGALTDSSFVGRGGEEAFSEAMVSGGACAPGALFLSFACFSAGVPKRSAHRFFTEDAGDELPGAPFVSPLPRALLAHPDGPVAFIGHVDRATSESFQFGSHKAPVAFFDFVTWALGRSGTLANAMLTFRDQVAEAGRKLGAELSPVPGRTPSPAAAVDAWIRYHDALGYVLLGDPAISLGKAFEPA